MNSQVLQKVSISEGERFYETGVKLSKTGNYWECESFNEEALRVIKLRNKWKPEKKDGEDVRVLMTIPVKFEIE